jgi:hypothetical protein
LCLAGGRLGGILIFGRLLLFRCLFVDLLVMVGAVMSFTWMVVLGLGVASA